METVTYDLLEDLLEDNYDKFDNEDKINIGEQAKVYEKNVVNKQINQKQKKETNDNYELEEGELLESQLSQCEISCMFQDDQILLTAFHEIVNGNHLIGKIYNFEHCPYCIFKSKTNDK